MKVKEVMNDLLLRAEPDRAGREPALSADEVVRGYRTIMNNALLLFYC